MVREEGHEWQGNTCRVCGSPKSADQLWAEELAREGRYVELARQAGTYTHKLQESGKQRKIYARLALMQAGEPAVDAVAGIITENGLDGEEFISILIASKSRSAALPLLSLFPRLYGGSCGEKMISFFVEMKAVEVAPGLVDLLKSDYGGTRALAAKALGRFRLPETIPALLKALDGDPHVVEGLKEARTDFARSLLNEFEQHRRAAGPRVESMSETEMLMIMADFASAYMRDDAKTLDRLYFTVRDIGEELNRRGGEAAMQEMIRHFSSPTTRYIDRTWSGIGSWQG
jgi:hypothetical protein